MPAALPAVAALLAPSAGMAAYQGDQSRKANNANMRRQQQAQFAAESAAQRQMRENAAALAKANAKKPDIASLLGDAQDAAKQGLGATMLTGAGGVDQSTLTLGRPSLLGQ